MTTYYPATNLIMEETVIVRDRVLPPHVYGQVVVDEGDEVTGTKVVARGRMPQEYAIFDIAEALRIDRSNTDKLNAAIEVEAGEPVLEGTPLATARRRRDRKRIPVSPAEGIVSLVENGRVVLQLNPETIQRYARIPGTVIGLISERGVRIRSTGALVQCAWGNGRFGFGSFYMEPETGLLSLADQDNILTSVRGNIYVLQRPITAEDLKLLAQSDLGGLVGPSMPFYLQEAAQMLKVPILLTEGFGNQKMSRTTYELLKTLHRQREGAFDASMPTRWEPTRPEIVLPGVSSGATEPDLSRTVRVGDQVRVRTGAFLGDIGEIVLLPEKPVRLDSGLRLPVAQVKLRNRPDKLLIPLANLEIMGNSK
jgi:hypothetical protein